jgi:hypothetical protein
MAKAILVGRPAMRFLIASGGFALGSVSHANTCSDKRICAVFSCGVSLTPSGSVSPLPSESLLAVELGGATP